MTYVAGDTCAHARNPTAALKALHEPVWKSTSELGHYERLS